MINKVIDLNLQEVEIISGGECRYVFRCSIYGGIHGDCGFVLECG